MPLPIWPELFFTIIILLVIYLLIFFNDKKKSTEHNNFLSITQPFAFICVLVFLVLAFFAPNCLSNYALDSSSSANTATTINGLMSPFIAIAAAFLTFMAFWVQYDANQRIIKENEKQQIERQFYEMLKIRQENVNAFTLDLPGTNDESKKIHGQDVFKSLREEFDLIFKIVNLNMNGQTKEDSFKTAYHIFFWGVKNTNLDERLKEIFEELIWKPQASIPNDNEIRQTAVGALTIYNPASKEISEARKLYQNANEFAKGRIYLLDPYYRHLYFMVKTIACSKSFKESNDGNDEKNAFLKILRAQMTSDEQILLLYNWHFGIGRKWESKDENQYFFSKQQMIHNIFDSNCIFTKEEIFGMFPDVTYEQKKKMFEHFQP